MRIMSGPACKLRPPTRRPPVPTSDCQNVMTTIALNVEKWSCESAIAQLNGNRRIQNWLVRINRSRAQGRRLPPDASTGTRAFNAPAAFSPNPTVTGSVIGSKHPSNHPFFAALSLQKSQSKAERSETEGTSCHGPPRDVQSQRFVQ